MKQQPLKLKDIEAMPFRYVFAEGNTASWAGNLKLEALLNKHKDRNSNSIFYYARQASLHEVISSRGGLIYGYKY